MLRHPKRKKINPIEKPFSGAISAENLITVKADDYRVSLILSEHYFCENIQHDVNSGMMI